MTQHTFHKSERGSQAAWKGFSSQTTYIAHRLLFLNDNSDFYPESVEDLMLKNNGVVTELVQVKNLGHDLSLSDFSLQKDDSFFRRFLAHSINNNTIILKVISFGNIGQELQGLLDGEEKHTAKIRKKLLNNHGYTTEDIDLIFSNIIIEKVNEDSLVSDIYEKLSSSIETMSAPNIVFDVLVSHVRELSRNEGSTSYLNGLSLYKKSALI